jgi:hypothetical protein
MVRRELSARLSKALGVQGVAAISSVPGQSGAFWLSILAAGAAEPDVIEVHLDQPASALRAVDAAAFTASSSSLLLRTLGLSLIDETQRPGPVVLDTGSAAGLAVGDALTSVNGQAVATAQDVARVLGAIGAIKMVTVKAQTRAGADKSADLQVLVGPRLIAWAPEDGPPNILLLDLRGRLADATGLDATSIRLNLAAALTRAGDPAGALALLDELGSPVAGITAATTSYLRGVALDALGRSAEAQQAWQLAARAATGVFALEDPPIAELAARRLRAPKP